MIKRRMNTQTFPTEMACTSFSFKTFPNVKALQGHGRASPSCMSRQQAPLLKPHALSTQNVLILAACWVSLSSAQL